MAISTNLPNRIKNTQLPLAQGLMPIFEAVQNSIHAIEELSDPRAGRIMIEIVRDPQQELEITRSKKRGPEAHANIIAFRVTDNGVGFTKKNMESFETLDSDMKAAIGGKGVGRLLWLKAFDYAEVVSVYQDEEGGRKVRSFRFTAKHGIVPGKTRASDEKSTHTVVTLYGFDKRYREASRRTAEAIANQLLEHCLWYYVREGGAPKIELRDGSETLDMDQVFEQHMHSSAQSESIEIKGHSFDLTHIKLRSTTSQMHLIGWCASNRLVKEEGIASKIPGLHGRLGQGDDGFVYACYVSSAYLDERVRPERTDFVLEQNNGAGLLQESEISAPELSKEVLGRIEKFLEPYLKERRAAGLDRVHRFVSTVQPRYRPILSRVPESELYVDPSISDKDLDLVLHKHRSQIERQLLSDGHKIMSPTDEENAEDYEARVRSYLELANDVKRSDLAEYVSHRKVILDLLRLAIRKDAGGQYSREDLIHELIAPLRKESTSIRFAANNLWLIDERLTFHDFMASDKPLKSMRITGAKEGKEPDILGLSVYDVPVLVGEGDPPYGSLVVLEIKRPMRNDAKAGEVHDPVEQALGYLSRVRKGGVKTHDGRPIPNADDIPGFCYVLCDMTSSVQERCNILGLTVTSDRMGYFGYNAPLKAYIEVISFDRLLAGGMERNRVFFDRLGLPNN